MPEVRFPDENFNPWGAKNTRLVEVLTATCQRYDHVYMLLCKEQSVHGIEQDPRGRICPTPKGNSDMALMDEILRIHNLTINTRIRVRALRSGNSSETYAIIAEELLESTKHVGIYI